MRPRHTVLALALLAALLLAPARTDARHAAAAAEGESSPGAVSTYSFFDPIIDLEQIISRRYVTQPDLKKLQQAALSAMVEALGDQYTEYVPFTDLAEFNKQIRGQYVGIGASVRMDEGSITIVSPLEDSPAYHAGIMAGDRIVAIDGVSTMGLSIDKAVDRLTGEPGSTVVVTIERGSERFDRPIVRRRIQTRSVSGVQRLHAEGWDFVIDPAARIGYIRVSLFTSATIPEFDAAISQLREQGLRGLVLDLRGNPGGLLAAATQMADLFLEEGLIVTTKGRTHEDESVYAVSEGTLPEAPLAVIINRESASASEVVAGALRDHGRAVIVGTRSFGKGSVQNVIPLPSGEGQIKITEQHYYGPSGKNLHRSDESTDWGVDPTPGFFVPMTDREYAEMYTVRRERDVIRAENEGAPAQPFDPSRILEDLKDPQLAAAVDAVRTKLESGEWRPISGEAREDAVQVEELRRMQLIRERIIRELERADRRIEAISSAVPQEKAERPALLPRETDLSGGRIEVYDKDGAVVATFDITGPGLERWLVDAPLEKKPG